MKKIVLFLFVALLAVIQAKPIELSEKASVNVYTFGPGNEYFSLFGHSSIRVYDNLKGYDLNYNFGIFSFEGATFLDDFMDGRLVYMLARYHFPSEVKIYYRDDRYIIRQQLNLTHTEKQALVDTLEQIYNSDARYYDYDFFYDNCATRIRDVIINKSRMSYDTVPLEITFRWAVKPYLTGHPWLNLGMNLGMGRMAERDVNSWEYMFLPDGLQKQMERVSYRDSDRKLVSSTQRVYNEQHPDKKGLGFWLFYVMIGIFTLMAAYSLTSKPGHVVAGNVLAAIYFALGMFLWILAIFNPMTITKMNSDLMWLSPLHILMMFKLFRRSKIFNFVQLVLLLTGMLYYFITVGIVWPVLLLQMPLMIFYGGRFIQLIFCAGDKKSFRRIATAN
jgi:hypothetical protein